MIPKSKDFRQKPSLTICPCRNYNTHVQAKYSGISKWQNIKAKATIYTWYTVKKIKIKRQINTASQRTTMSNPITHIHNIQKKAE